MRLRDQHNQELFAVILAFDTIQELFNLLSDSLLPNLVEAHIRLASNPVSPLMIQAHYLLKQRINPISLQHLRSHQNLPGFLSKGNNFTNKMAPMLQCNTVTEATNFQLLIYVNWRSLKYPHVPVKDLKRIVQTCQSCQPFLQVPLLQTTGSNPRGLRPNHLWQIDVLHYSPFWKLKYIFFFRLIPIPVPTGHWYTQGEKLNM